MISARRKVDAFAALDKDFDAKGWGAASNVIAEVRAVPTIFPDINRVTKVGGWPTDRVTLIHGPSNDGKTAFLIGLLLSFLMRGHFAALVDAEASTPLLWLQQMMGIYAGSAGFRALYPKSYESTVDMVRAWCETIGEARVKGRIPSDTTGLIAIDSLRKLVPKRLLDKLLKEGAEGDEDAKDHRGKKKAAGGVDGMGGRGAMYKAALNSAWMDELTQLLKQTGTGLVLVGREYENGDAGLNFGAEDYKVGGGKSVIFESHLRARVVREGFVMTEPADGKGAKELVAQRHRVEIHKTKVGGKDERIPQAHFHTKTGTRGVGFDRARDLLEVAEEHGVVQSGGSRYSFGGERFGHGKEKAIDAIDGSPTLFEAIERKLEEELRPANAVPEAEPTGPELEPVAGPAVAGVAPPVGARSGMKAARKAPKRKAVAKKKGARR